MKRLVFDTESDGLLYDITKLWCIVAKDMDTGDIQVFPPDKIREGLEYLQTADILIGHHISGYDYVVINKLYGISLSILKARDTLVMSKLFFPEQKIHSLDFWGKKLKRKKPVHTDWTQYSDEMLHRCTEDVEINHVLYEYLVEKEASQWKWGNSIIMEQYFSYDQGRQEITGVTIDTALARKTLATIDEELRVIDGQLDERLPLRIVDRKAVNKPFVKSGDYSAMVYSWYCGDDRDVLTVQAPFSRISYEKINLNSDQQIKKYLLSVGWVPTTWNYKKDKETGFFVKDDRGRKIRTSPKITEDSFPSIKDDTGKLVVRRSVIMHRRISISNIKDPDNKGILAQIRSDGKVPAEGILCGTNTGRTKHKKAVCNIPKAKEKVPYGIAMRSLFCVREPHFSMLGADLDQIEARITAHYAALFDQGAYWRTLQEYKDIHQYNADMLGVDRDPTAKSFQFAIFYGARAAKIASIVGCSRGKAQEYIDTFWSGTQGVFKLIQALEEYYDQYGFIEGLDGRKLFIRAKYKLLNSLIQSGAAIIFKKWGVIANRKLEEAGMDCKQIIAYHDEFEYKCRDEHIELSTRLIKESAVEAGEFFRLKVPITVDVKVGMNWAEVH